MPLQVKSIYYSYEALVEDLLDHIDEHGCLFKKMCTKPLLKHYKIKMPNRAIKYSIIILRCIFCGEQVDALFPSGNRRQRYSN